MNISDGWKSERKSDGWVVVSPVGDSYFIQDSAPRIADELLRQLAMDLYQPTDKG